MAHSRPPLADNEPGASAVSTAPPGRRRDRRRARLIIREWRPTVGHAGSPALPGEDFAIVPREAGDDLDLAEAHRVGWLAKLRRQPRRQAAFARLDVPDPLGR